MTYFNCSIAFPYKNGGKKQIDYVEKDWKLSKNKFIELQISKWGHSWTLIGLTINPSWYRDHAGLFLEFELFNYALIINFYDHRHWYREKGRWFLPGEEEEVYGDGK